MTERAAQKRGEIFTGIASIHGQDQAVTESMGGITDHGFENLGPSDLMVARTRRRLLRAARALDKDGTLPPGVDDPGIYTAVRSGDFLADAKIAWRDAYELQMRAAVRPLAQAAERAGNRSCLRHPETARVRPATHAGGCRPFSCAPDRAA